MKPTREVFKMNKNGQQFIAQKIRTQYVEKQTSELDELRQLDKKVRRPANVFAYVFGGISAIVMGMGMSLVMTDVGASVGIENALPVGIVIGVVGMLMALVNYPIFKCFLNSRKAKYGDEVIALSDKIIGE